jgi:23S rRNA (guanine2445-N2)-methyltransferase / 23S rRNA (guanine2069-N7)-methyltransferase
MASNKILNFFATCPKNLENLLETELISFGAKETKITIAGVEFAGHLEVAYRACLWSRIANKILLPIKKCKTYDAEDLYNSIYEIDWLEHISTDSTFLVDFVGESESINNTHFGALKVKDAIIDQVREKTGVRLSIDKESPKIRINVYLHYNKVTISIDLSGGSLHRRGYRDFGGLAPLKENLAAAVLYRANWPKVAALGQSLLDPMCGSGTLIIEAALMAADIAPGLHEQNFGFLHWQKHDDTSWQKLLADAKKRREIGLEKLKEQKIEIRGYDISSKIVKSAEENIANIGLEKYVKVLVKPLDKFTPPTHHGHQCGLIVTNPPYGERLGNEETAKKLYETFGKVLKENFAGWQVAVLVSNEKIARNMGLFPHKQYSLYNGAIACKLLLFSMYSDKLSQKNIYYNTQN